MFKRYVSAISFCLLLVFIGTSTANAIETLLIEAEDADSITAPFHAIDDANASGGQYITVEAGKNSNDNPPTTGVAKFNVTLTEGGTYKLFLRVLCQVGGDGDDSCWVRIQGATLNMEVSANEWIKNNNVDGNMQAASTEVYFWSQVRHYVDHPGELIEMEMAAGNYTIEIAYREDGLRIDSMILTNDPGASNNNVPSPTASNPSPANGAPEVLLGTQLVWNSGIFAETHNVFLGTDINEVANATISEHPGVELFEALDVNVLDPGILEYDKVYYWRVDEISPGAEYKGNVWKFTLEPVALQLPYESFEKVTAISSSGEKDPNDTVNEEGLDPNDEHSSADGLWTSDGEDDVNDGIWIQYEFDKQYKIHDMLVWNFNHKINWRYGFKDVLVQYSADGQTWLDINDVNQFAVSSNYSHYKYNTVVDFNDVLAKAVRITAFSNWGNAKYFGLSEVRFSYIPVWPRNLAPADGTEDVDFDAMLTWRRGREAVEHHVYIDTDKVAVKDKTVDPIVTEISNYSLSLNLNSTYYWRVDEVNPGKVPSVWGSELMSFSTVSSILVDGFEEGYGDTGTDAVYLTWKDAQELGNKTVNGSIMGRLKKPYLQTINRNGNFSAPFTYNNTKKAYSEIIADTSQLLNGTDWSAGNPNILEIWFRSDANDVNDAVLDRLYVKINNGNKIYYEGPEANLRRTSWSRFKVPLDGVTLSNVTSITIGFDRIGSTGGTGIIYLDDIQLTYSEPVVEVNPGTDNLIALYEMENNLLDTSGSAIDGTFISDSGTATYVDGPSAAYGKALEINSDANEVVDLGPSDPFNFTGSFSVAFWANIQDWSNEWGHAMIATRGEGVGFSIRRGGNWVAGIQGKTATGICFTTRGIYLSAYNQGNDDMMADEPVQDTWTHIACVFDKDRNFKSIYLDGELVATSETTEDSVLIESTTQASIGARANSDNTGFENHFDGTLDDIRVFDDALTAGEVMYLYKN